MRLLKIALVGLAVTLATSPLRADDLTGANKLLCTAVQATKCEEGGDCLVDLPWNLNVPQFIEVDLGVNKLSTTKASGENRETPILHVIREGGVIVLQGFEKGRAFSLVITEATGRASIAVATEGKAVAIFGACTPMPAASTAGGK
jgi:hypothetical protein